MGIQSVERQDLCRIYASELQDIDWIIDLDAAKSRDDILEVRGENARIGHRLQTFSRPFGSIRL